MSDQSMDCCYINLDEAGGRREQLEANLAAVPHQGWRFLRFAAIHGEADLVAQCPGSASNAEKACLHSHWQLLKHYMNSREALLVLEDDACVGDKTFATLSQLAATEANWDLVFTDLTILSFPTMMHLLHIWREVENGTAPGRLLPLGSPQFGYFAGSTAYLVSPKGRVRLHQLLSALPSCDFPYDILLRGWIMDGQLTAYVMAPFVTSLSAESQTSMVTPSNDLEVNNTVWRLFRQYAWLHRNLADCKIRLTEIKKHFDSRNSRSLGRWLPLLLQDIMLANHFPSAYDRQRTMIRVDAQVSPLSRDIRRVDEANTASTLIEGRLF